MDDRRRTTEAAFMAPLTAPRMTGERLRRHLHALRQLGQGALLEAAARRVLVAYGLAGGRGGHDTPAGGLRTRLMPYYSACHDALGRGRWAAALAAARARAAELLRDDPAAAEALPGAVLADPVGGSG